MFYRLLLTFLGFAALSSALAAVLILRETHLDWSVGRTVGIVAVAGILAVAPAWVFARAFVRPFREMQAGAEQIAGGDFGQRIHGGDLARESGPGAQFQRNEPAACRTY